MRGSSRAGLAGRAQGIEPRTHGLEIRLSLTSSEQIKVNANALPFTHQATPRLLLAQLVSLLFTLTLKRTLLLISLPMLGIDRESFKLALLQ